MPGVCIDIYGTVHYKELSCYSIRVGHSPFILSRYCHDYAESNIKQYSIEITAREKMTDIL